MAKLGPWASRDIFASVRRVFDRFFTHFYCTVVVVVVAVVVVATVVVAVGTTGAVGYIDRHFKLHLRKPLQMAR